MIQQSVKVLWNKKLSTAYYKIGLTCSDHYSAAKPGQFVMLGLAGQKDPLLRRPFSIHNLLIENGITQGFELLYKVVGKATASLAQRIPEDIVDVFGPLGSGFIISTRTPRVFVVAGGVGVAPLVFLVSDLHRKNADLSSYRAFIGGRTEADLLCCNEFSDLGISVTTTCHMPRGSFSASHFARSRKLPRSKRTTRTSTIFSFSTATRTTGKKSGPSPPSAPSTRSTTSPTPTTVAPKGSTG